MISLANFHAILDSLAGRGYPLNTNQRAAVDHPSGPLWLIAGPGSGKSEVLVTRPLRLLCVDSMPPRSILLTTFTVKAARNLEDRLAAYLSALQAQDPTLISVDISDLRIGTIHSLCNDILQEYRFPGYQNVRLLDQVEQHLFIYLTSPITKHNDLAFWRYFDYAVRDWRDRNFVPSQWKRAKAAADLFNHIVEDVVDVRRMKTAGSHWATLAAFYEQYAAGLRGKYRCDFAHLQARFLEFLQQPPGRQLLVGVEGKTPPLQHVLVDEYQDTNPLQERIYLALANRSPHNLTVVGDDDQALYRFRGGTVAGMVNFDKACVAQLHISPSAVPLVDNYRSHANIVQFFNTYISSFPEMNRPGVRAPGKLPVVPKASVAGTHPAIAWITRTRARDLPDAVVSLIEDHLKTDGVISDYSQCVLLVRSAKDSPGNAGPYLAAMRARNIPVYNPRSKTFMESEEVQCLLAVLVHVVDWNHWFNTVTLPGTGRTPAWVASVNSWINALDQALVAIPALRHQVDDYVAKGTAALQSQCAAKPESFLDVNLHQILFRILSLEPFRTWRMDPNRNQRLAKVTRLFDSYHSFNLDALRSDPTGSHVDASFLGRFFSDIRQLPR